MVALLGLGCSKEELPSVQIEELLQPYFDAFAEAGAERGVLIDFSVTGIEGVFGDSDGLVSGQCQHRSEAPNRVLVDRDYWLSASTIQKEFLIFHELGHCYLLRSHDDTRNDRGECLSIMHSSATACRNRYSSTTREEYLDELFSH